MVVIHGAYIHDTFYHMTRDGQDKIRSRQISDKRALDLWKFMLRMLKLQGKDISPHDVNPRDVDSVRAFNNQGFTNKGWRILAQRKTTLYVLYKHDFSWSLYVVPAVPFIEAWLKYSWGRKDTLPVWPVL